MPFDPNTGLPLPPAPVAPPSKLQQVGGLAAQAAIAFIAAHKAGPQAVAALVGAINQHKQQAEQQARQTQLDQSALQTQAENRANLQADNARADEAAKRAQQQQEYTQGQSALTGLDTYAQTFGDPNNPVSDPTQADAAVRQRAADLAKLQGKPADTYSGFVPPMAPIISGKRKKQAQTLYEQAEKLYGPDAMANDSITLKSEAFGDVKPSALRSMFAPQATDQTGQDAKPYVKPPTLNATQQAVIDAFVEKNGRQPSAQERVTLLGDAAKVDDKPSNAPRDRYNVQPFTRKDGTTGFVRVNMDTGETTEVSLPQGGQSGRASDTERLSAAYYDRTTKANLNAAAFEQSLGKLGDQIDVQLPNLLKSETGQRYRQAEAEFINAALRRESGAAIQPSEYTRFEDIYFVKPGDTPATIAQKQTARQRVIDGFKVAAGGLGGSAGPQVGERRTINGQLGEWDGKGWKAVAK